jgi:hypothetical protein
LGDNIGTIKKKTETLIDGSKDVFLEVNAVNTKYMLLPHHQNAGQNHDKNIANRSFENVEHFKYLETRVTDEILIQVEIRRRMNSYSAHCHSAQNLLSSCLLSKNGKIWTFKAIIFPVVLPNKEVHNLYSSPNIIRMINSMRMK